MTNVNLNKKTLIQNIEVLLGRLGLSQKSALLKNMSLEKINEMYENVLNHFNQAAANTFNPVGRIIDSDMVILGDTDNGSCFKSPQDFYTSKVDEVCYIPEYGVGDIHPNRNEYIRDVYNEFTYADLLELCEAFVKLHDPNQDPRFLVIQLFEQLDCQFPSTVLDEWSNTQA